MPQHFLCHLEVKLSTGLFVVKQNFSSTKNSLVESFICDLTTWETEMTPHRQTLLLYCILSSQCLSRDCIYSCKHTKVHVLDLNGEGFFVIISKISLQTHLNKHVCQCHQCACSPLCFHHLHHYMTSLAELGFVKKGPKMSNRM